MATRLCKIVADFRTSLAVKMSAGATTGTLLSATDDDGSSLPAGNYFLTIDGDNSQKEHITCALSGTALTVVKSVTRQGVQSSGTVREHRAGATVTITDFAHIKEINDLLSGTVDLNSATPLKYDGTATISNDAHLATKKYVDDVAISGAADASTSVKGITKMSVAPASATSPIAVGDNDPRVPTQNENDACAGTGTPSSSNKFVTYDTLTTAASALESLSNKDTTTTLGTSDTKYPSQKAVKTYVDAFSPTCKSGTTTYSLATASGSQTIAHGLGRTPKSVKIKAFGPLTNYGGYPNSIGSYDGSSNACIYYGASDETSLAYYDTVGNSSTYGVYVYYGSSGGENSQKAIISVDATNITLAWTKTNSPTGTAYILWEVQ